jgi:two-component sensor histidine kinase
VYTQSFCVLFLAGEQALTMSNRGYRIAVSINIVLFAIFAFAAFLIVSIVDNHAREAALEEAEAKAHMLLSRNLATHSYFASELKPKVFELTDGLRPEGYFEPAWMSSTYAVREILKLFTKDEEFSDYYYKEAAINARTPANEADEIEKDFIRRLNSDSKLNLESMVREINGEPYFVVMHRGETMDQSCLMCHSVPEAAPSGLVNHYGTERSFNRHEEDVVSALSLRIPLNAAFERADALSSRLKKLLIMVLGFLLIAQAFITNTFKASNEKLKKEVLEKQDAETALKKQSHALGERVKELNCLYVTSKLLNEATTGKDDLLNSIVNIIPPSWQYPEHTCARMTFNDKAYTTYNFKQTEWKMSSPITVSGNEAGSVEVYYLKEMPEDHEGPFLKEERHLIDGIAQLLSVAFERRKIDDALRQTLQDKDMLMREIHHRVKNNLVVIQSLLSLQLRDVDDDISKEYLVEAQNRVKSITLIHDLLHRSEDLKSIRSSGYIENLVETLFRSYNIAPGQIELRYDIQDASLDVDTMIPLGLIINELVSNALKYAFPDGMKGEILVSLKETADSGYELVVRDTGIGMPDDLEIETAESLGLTIVNSLVGQIGGTLEVSGRDGAEFRIAFTEKELPE